MKLFLSITWLTVLITAREELSSVKLFSIDRTFEVHVYAHFCGSNHSIANTSLAFLPASECVEGIAPAAPRSTLLVDWRLASCYPEEGALKAQEAGYEAVLYLNPYHNPGHEAIHVRNHGRGYVVIPVFSVSALDLQGHDNLSDWASADLVPASNAYLETPWKVTVGFFSASSGGLNVFKLYFCGKYIASAFRSSRFLPVPLVVVLSEIASSFIFLSWALDPVGIFGIYPYLTWYLISIAGTFFNFLSSYAVSLALLDCVGDFDKHPVFKRVLLHSWFGCFLLLIVGSTLTGFFLTNDGAVVVTLAMFMYQVFFGIFLFRTKSYVVKTLSDSNNTQVSVKAETMSFWLWISSFFTFVYVATVISSSIAVIGGHDYIIPIGLMGLALPLTGIMQVKALPLPEE